MYLASNCTRSVKEFVLYLRKRPTLRSRRGKIKNRELSSTLTVAEGAFKELKLWLCGC